MQHQQGWTRFAAALAFVGTTAFGAPVVKAKISIVSPKSGAHVSGPKVNVVVKVTGFKLVAAGLPVANGEGHLHFFIDVPASSVKVGEMIPLDQPTKYMHAGKEPFDSRELDLAPGRHTITAVMANSAHLRAAGVPAARVTFTVR